MSLVLLPVLSLMAAAQFPLAGDGGPGKPDAVTVRGVTFKLVRIPPGEFRMGSDRDGEKPRRSVRVSAFDLGVTEVTVRQFRAFVEATGYRTDAEQEKDRGTFVCKGPQTPNAPWRSRGYWQPVAEANWRNPGFPQSEVDPVVAVSWHDAVEFTKWLSRETGDEWRLPSEAEWEFAARAGNEADGADNPGQAGWYRDNSGGRTHPAGGKQPNAWGLHDMLGNAWEWTADVWAADYSGAPDDGKARTEGGSGMRGIPAGDGRVLRGGGWGLELDEMRFAGRPPFELHQRCNNSGFRLARTTGPRPAR